MNRPTPQDLAVIESGDVDRSRLCCRGIFTTCGLHSCVPKPMAAMRPRRLLDQNLLVNVMPTLLASQSPPNSSV